MNLSEPLVLPPDVQVEPVDSLAFPSQAKLRVEKGGYLVYRKRSRAPMSVVSTDMGLLLLAFRSPQTVVEALKSLSTEWSLEDREDLLDCMEALRGFVTEELLVPAGSELAEPLTPSLDLGEALNGFVVTRNLVVAQDSEVYQVRTVQGDLFALKIARTRRSESRCGMRRELGALERLGGAVGPALVTEGTFRERIFGVTEWIVGTHPDLIAGDLQLGPGPADPAEILSLCGRILAAYAEMHSRGVLHGDVQPSNLLVAEGGEVRVVDFGLSLVRDGSPQALSRRGGIPPFYDPEHATSLLEGTSSATLTEAGEQYSLAALLFFLCTGEHYCAFHPRQRELLRQIATARPRSFPRCGAPAWPEVERILARALEKAQERRFSSVSEMADHWNRIPPASGHAWSHRKRGTGDTLASRMAQQLGLEGGLDRARLGPHSTASVNRGAAGIAFGLYRISVATGDPMTFAASQVWIRIAQGEARKTCGFSSGDPEAPARRRRGASLHHFRSGVYLVRALLGRAGLDPVEENAGIRGFLRAGSRLGGRLDLTHGNAGILLGTALLLEMEPRTGRNALLGLGKTALASLMAKVDGPDPIPENSENLGMAHGWAGFLYAILRWCRTTHTEPPPRVFCRLEELARLAHRSGPGLKWRWVVPNSYEGSFGHMPGWCNGSAGFIHLFSLASEAFRHEDFLQVAEGAAWDVWDSRGSPGIDLCCGMGGRAYALLNLHRATGEVAWRERAHLLAERAADRARTRGETENRFSLYRGELGVAVLMAEMERPEEAGMPLFEPEDWSSS